MDNYDFSVLMSVYYKENPEWMRMALDSVINQTLMPNEIVLVEDGILTDELYSVIEEYKMKYANLFKSVSLKKNSGLGEALRIGVENCTYDYIARMDTDDISRADRFEKQIQFLKKHPDTSVIGSWIAEFEDNPDKIISYRKLPLTHNEILKFSKFRNPLNHMTVILKKEDIIAVGNYQPMLYMEDYYLWVRLLHKNYKVANIGECLVNARAGSVMLKRRANLKYFFSSEYPLQIKLLKLNYITITEFMRNIFLKFLLRALPKNLMSFVYKKLLRKDIV